MSESLADVVHEAVERAKADEERKPVTLTEFLLARIAEDEEVARNTGPDWESDDFEQTAHDDAMRDRQPHEWRCAWRMAEMSEPCRCGYPARVLAECEAKRRIVAEWQRFETENRRAYGVNPVPSIIARALAQPYAEHPDFDPSWRL